MTVIKKDEVTIKL